LCFPDSTSRAPRPMDPHLLTCTEPTLAGNVVFAAEGGTPARQGGQGRRKERSTSQPEPLASAVSLCPPCSHPSVSLPPPSPYAVLAAARCPRSNSDRVSSSQAAPTASKPRSPQASEPTVTSSVEAAAVLLLEQQWWRTSSPARSPQASQPTVTPSVEAAAVLLLEQQWRRTSSPAGESSLVQQSRAS